MGRTPLLLLGLLLGSCALVGCGGSESDETVTVRERVVSQAPALTSPDTSADSGPRLGDGCTVEANKTSELEISAVRGPLECSEVERVAEVYYASAPTNGVGSGGALEVAGWTCISMPPPEEPLAGKCEEAGAEGREFEIYEIGWALRPVNQNTDCHLPPPDGAGQFNLRATNIDCQAAELIMSDWSLICARLNSNGACPIGNGITCRFEELGLELAIIRCHGRRQQLVTFETGA